MINVHVKLLVPTISWFQIQKIVEVTDSQSLQCLHSCKNLFAIFRSVRKEGHPVTKRFFTDGFRLCPREMHACNLKCEPDMTDRDRVLAHDHFANKLLRGKARGDCNFKLNGLHSAIPNEGPNRVLNLYALESQFKVHCSAARNPALQSLEAALLSRSVKLCSILLYQR